MHSWRRSKDAMHRGRQTSCLSAHADSVSNMIEHTFGPLGILRSTDVAALMSALRALGSSAESATELIDQITVLEQLKSAAAAAQARATAAFAAKQRAEQRAAGVQAGDVGKGIAAQIALARCESPRNGARLLGLAEALVHELPATMAALEAGHISEWRATLVCKESACLTVEHRNQVDAELAAYPGGMGALGDQQIAREARRIAYRLDPHAMTRRASNAAADRNVSIRPAPDTMTRLSALLPVAQGVAAYAALCRAADSARAAGDQRRRGQVMADTLVQRVTGQTSAEAVPVEIQLVMTDQTLLADRQEPAELEGGLPVPAPLARQWLRGDAGASATKVKAWIRRLYTSPTTGQLIAMESRRRCFDKSLRRFVITVDKTCRTPWCDAPIRHIDHALRAADGGETSLDNSDGLCEACNYVREAPKWATVRRPQRELEIITPTGHRYASRPPPPVGHRLVRASSPDASPVARERSPNPVAS